VLFGSSPCWFDHCVSTPCDSITAAVPRWFSWFFALLAQSLRFNTMWLDHCGGSTLDLLVLRPAGSITAFQLHVTRSLRRFHVGSPGSSPCWLDHCASTPCDSITAEVQCWISCVYSSVGSVLFGSSPLDLSSMFGVLSSAGLLLFDSSTLDLSLRSVFLFSSLWFFALLARSLRFNTM
jgi:hypothetical protein